MEVDWENGEEGLSTKDENEDLKRGTTHACAETDHEQSELRVSDTWATKSEKSN